MNAKDKHWPCGALCPARVMKMCMCDKPNACKEVLNQPITKFPFEDFKDTRSSDNE